MSIGDKIREKRKNKGYTLEQLADEIGITKSTVLKYENGTIAIPSDKIEKIAKVLSVSPAYLMGWEDTKGKEESEEYRWIARNAKKLDNEKQKTLKAIMRAAFKDAFGDDE